VKRFLATSFVALSVVAADADVAHAGGFFLLDRGVRPNGRAGAFVAGADDPNALSYNPAGLAFSGRQLVLDASIPLLFADYTRVDSGGTTLPTVEAGQVPLPIPTLAYSDHFGLEKVTFGAGIWAPMATLLEWPDSASYGGVRGPAPQRYSLYSMRGTILSTIAVGAAYQPIPELSIGVTAGVNTGSFAARTTLSACDGAICTQPEDPDYDSLVQLNAPLLIAPAFSLGVTYAHPSFRIGASVSTPYRLHGEADLEARVPSAPIFDQSTIEGAGGGAPTADITIRFPWVVRAGVEVRPMEDLRIEAAVVLETWSRQNEILLAPNDVAVRNVFAVGDYDLGPISIARNMKNTVSVRLGGEYDLGVISLRGGISYETGSFGDAYLTALTLDSDKTSVMGGLSINVSDSVSLDGTIGYVFMRDRTVDNSRVTQPNAIRPDFQPPVYIGNGHYEMDALYIGAGLRIRFAPPVAAANEEPEVVPEPVVPEPVVTEPVATEPAALAPTDPAPAPTQSTP